MQLKKFISMCPFSFSFFFFFLSFSGSCLSVFCRVSWLFPRTVARGPSHVPYCLHQYHVPYCYTKIPIFIFTSLSCQKYLKQTKKKKSKRLSYLPKKATSSFPGFFFSCKNHGTSSVHLHPAYTMTFCGAAHPHVGCPGTWRGPAVWACAASEDKVIQGTAGEIFVEADELRLCLAGAGACSLKSKQRFRWQTAGKQRLSTDSVS